MNARGRSIFVVITALVALLADPLVLADETEASDPHPGMVIEDDVVSEWKKPRLTEMTRLTDLARASEAAKNRPYWSSNTARRAQYPDARRSGWIRC